MVIIWGEVMAALTCNSQLFLVGAIYGGGYYTGGGDDCADL